MLHAASSCLLRQQLVPSLPRGSRRTLAASPPCAARRLCLRASVAEGSSGSDGNGPSAAAPPTAVPAAAAVPPAHNMNLIACFDSKLDFENWGRVATMTDQKLRQRLARMRNVAKLSSFIKVLEVCGKAELAIEARHALAAISPSAAARLGSSPAGGVAAGGSGAAAVLPAGQAQQQQERQQQQRQPGRFTKAQLAQMKSAKRQLEAQGMQVYLPSPEAGSGRSMDWGTFAGYEEQKQQVEDTLLLPLAHPEVFDELAQRTRGTSEAAGASNRTRAVLFEGPPGTGKTTCARVIAEQVLVPLVVVNFSNVLSKWYGDDEKKLSELLRLCESFPTGAVVFFDELDSLLPSRDGNIHECTRRLLGILLAHLDGFDKAHKGTVFVGATNRKTDLDPALRSRFATAISFGLPGEQERADILRQYARQLSNSDLLALAKATKGMSGRDLKAVCDQTERRFLSDVLRGRADGSQLPGVLAYLSIAQKRQEEAAHTAEWG